VGIAGASALKHTSFPELDPLASCFVQVRYGAGGPRPDASPPGCGYPSAGDLTATLERLQRRADVYDALASGARADPMPAELACALPDEVRRAAARANALTTRALARRLSAHAPYPYAVVGAFGYGFRDQGKSALVRFRPGDACPAADARESALLSVNLERASRAAAAYAAGVAPVVVVSGGAVHSALTEAFLLDYLLTCRLDVPADAVVLDPCADHTHTNMRNTGSVVVALGGRTAYLVTDDGIQADYLEEWTPFDLISGSIDQRSLRDFGYLLGSYRRASVGMKAGFWYTPYRFWAESARGLGGFTCVP
jgi:hypothetical protein